MRNSKSLLWLFVFAIGLSLPTVGGGEEAVRQVSPLITVTTTKSMPQALADLKDAIINHNYVFIRQQDIDSRLTDTGTENGQVKLVYFCKFSMLDQALKADRRVGVFLPCKITLIQKADHIEMIAINPKAISKQLNEEKLNKLCERLTQDYSDILEEARL